MYLSEKFDRSIEIIREQPEIFPESKNENYEENVLSQNKPQFIIRLKQSKSISLRYSIQGKTWINSKRIYKATTTLQSRFFKQINTDC